MIQRRFRPLAGESIVGLTPPSPGDLSPFWRRRLRLFSGRALTASALRQEQTVRAGLLSTSAQLLSAGVIEGLQIIASSENNTAFLNLSPGLGLTATGEPITVPTAMRVPLRAINNSTANLLGILVLEPVELRIPGELDPIQNDLGDQCEYDPATDAFVDWRLVDGCQLRYVPWPIAELGTLPSSNIRNVAAQRIFRAEEKLGPDGTFSWEELGLAVALIATDGQSRITFLDRSSVVRDGGRPRERSSLLLNTGHQGLWQAQLMQFSEHLDQLNLSPSEAAGQFTTLPPCGLMPLQYFSIAFNSQAGAILRQTFFPANHSLTVRPVVLEQLDALLEPVASFSPIAMDASERLEVLLPVPQVFFDKDLLVAELIDPVFTNSLAEAIARRANALGYRALLRDRLNKGERALSGQERSFATNDPNQADPNEAINPNPPVDPQNSPVDLDQLSNNAQVELEKSLLRLLKDPNQAKTHSAVYLKLGLVPAAEHLEALADRGDDIINSGFLRAQADMYRLRQLLTSGTSMSRLAISPALVGIADAVSSTGREEAINKVLTELKANKDSSTILKRTIRSTRAVTIADFQISIQDLDRAMDVTGDEFHADQDQPNVMTADSVSALRAAARSRAGTTPFPKPNFREDVVVRKDNIFTSPKKDFTERLPSERIPPPVRAEPERDVVTTEPVVGRQDIRATGTLNRLNLAKGPEARDFALSTKFTIINSLKNTIEEQSNPELLKLSMVFGGVLIPGLGVRNGANWVFEKVGAADANLRRQNLLLSALDNAAITNILQEPDDANLTDEAGHFSASVDLIEHAIAALRGAEFFTESLRTVASVCRKHAMILDQALDQYERRLAVIEDTLGEARQDTSFVRALLAEEQQRVELINQRRARVLAEQVPFLAFRRPPSANTFRSPTTRTLNPEPAAPAVPVCLSQDLNPPEELQSFVDLLRESPVRWFPKIAAALNRMDRRPQFEQLLLVAQSRYTAQSSVIYRETEFLKVTRGRFEAPLFGLLSAQRNRTLKQRQPLGFTQSNSLAGMAWTEAQRFTRDVVSIGDLIEGSRPEVGRIASLELDRISRVSACLVNKFAEVRPEIRLDWALRFSQFDEQITLRTLSMLPRWEEIDYLDRLDLQSYADWLYAQIDSDSEEAIETIGNIVQAALLLASHAPVNRLLQGMIDEARDVEVGQAASAIFDAVHLPQLRRGLLLHVMQNDTVVAHAVVDDLLDVRAQIRITNNFTGNAVIKLGQGTRVVNPQPGSASRLLEQGGLTRTQAMLSTAVRATGR
jgi:hypothetical protein